MPLVDSDFLIQVLRKEAAAVRLLHAMEAKGRPSVSAVSAFEVTDISHHRRRESALAALETLDVIPVDGSVALAASRLSTELRERGRTLPMADLLIAATSPLGDLPLVTRNTRRFRRIGGLRLVSW